MKVRSVLSLILFFFVFLVLGPRSVGAIPINCGDTNVAGITSLPNSFQAYSCDPNIDTSGNEQIYDFTLTSTSSLQITLRSTAELHLFLLDGTNPDPVHCLAMDHLMMAGQRTLIYLAASPGSYQVRVDGALTTPMPFTISLVCQPVNATDIHCGDQNVAATPGATNLIGRYPCASDRCYTGGEAFFALDLAQTANIYVNITMDLPGTDMDLILLPSGFDSGLPHCLAWGDSDLFYPAAKPGRYIIAVDGCQGSTGAFHISVFCGAKIDCDPPTGTLVCDGIVAGDTRTGTNLAERYSCSKKRFDGPEAVYLLTNPSEQQVDIALVNAAPGLSVFMLGTCDEGQCIDSDGDCVIRPRLAPGDYYVVVDGENGDAGTFELIVFCGPPRLEPASLDLAMRPGECVDELKTVIFPTHIAQGDVMFSIDCTGSMGGEIEQVRTNINDIVGELSLIIDDLHFGLATFNEYAVKFTDTVCPWIQNDPGPGATPFTLNLPLTNDLAAMQAAVNQVQILGGGIESYTRTFYEAYANPNIGWRKECARKIWINFGDELPQDCNVEECIGGINNTGRDPGPDNRTGTADDVILLPALDAMTANEIILIHIDSSEIDHNRKIWSCLAERTGGSILETYQDGTIPGDMNFAEAISKPVKSAVRACDNLTLSASPPPYDTWLQSVTPPSYAGIKTPFRAQFTIRICVPMGTPNGDYDFQVTANCQGKCLASADMVQNVHILVSDQCLATAAPIPNEAICEGETVTLDGSGSRTEFCSGATAYRWLEGAAVVRDWSTDPTVQVSPGASTTYTLEVRCSAEHACTSSVNTDVLVTSIPTPDAGPDAALCAGQSATLNGGGSSTAACSGVLEYRWRDGTTIIRDWLTDPLVAVTPAATSDYFLDVRCSADPDCAASDTIRVSVAPYPVADAGPDREICEGESAILDGSLSSVPSCGGAAEYRWREGAAVVRGWSTDPTFAVAPATTSTYSLDVRCSTSMSCESSASALVFVAPYPLATAGADTTFCKESFIDLSAGGSPSAECSVPLEYRWRIGALVLRDWDPDSSYRVQPPEEAVFEVDVRCPLHPYCVSTDAVSLTKDCPMAVTYGSYGARPTRDGIAVYWNALTEIDTLAYAIERAPDPTDAMRVETIGFIEARGSGSSYEFCDAQSKGADPALFYYRVVEVTADGLGDETPFFRANARGRTVNVERNRAPSIRATPRTVR